MKKTSFLIIVTLLIGCSQTSEHKKAVSAGPNKSQAQAAKPATKKGILVINKAMYGNLPDGMAVDVTDKVRGLVKDSTLNVRASDDIFGNPYNGTMKLKIIKASVKVFELNLGDDDGAGDITSTIKQFQVGNCLLAKMTVRCRWLRSIIGMAKAKYYQRCKEKMD